MSITSREQQRESVNEAGSEPKTNANHIIIESEEDKEVRETGTISEPGRETTFEAGRGTTFERGIGTTFEAGRRSPERDRVTTFERGIGTSLSFSTYDIKVKPRPSSNDLLQLKMFNKFNKRRTLTKSGTIWTFLKPLALVARLNGLFPYSLQSENLLKHKKICSPPFLVNALMILSHIMLTIGLSVPYIIEISYDSDDFWNRAETISLKHSGPTLLTVVLIWITVATVNSHTVIITTMLRYDQGASFFHEWIELDKKYPTHYPKKYPHGYLAYILAIAIIIIPKAFMIASVIPIDKIFSYSGIPPLIGYLVMMELVSFLLVSVHYPLYLLSLLAIGLEHRFQEINKALNINHKTGDWSNLEELRTMHNTWRKKADQLCRTFSTSLFSSTGISTIFLLISSFMTFCIIIPRVFRTNDIKWADIAPPITVLTIGLLLFNVFNRCHQASLVGNEAKNLISNVEQSETWDQKKRRQLDEWRWEMSIVPVKLTGGGYFNFDLPELKTRAETWLTFMVILLQFHQADEQ